MRLPMLEQYEAGRPPKETPPSSGAGRLLVVDDNPESSEGMAMLLGLFGYDARSVVNLKTALLEARMFRPTVVVMDIAMPGVDGYEVARQMRSLEETRNAVYIGPSGYGRPDDRTTFSAASKTALWSTSSNLSNRRPCMRFCNVSSGRRSSNEFALGPDAFANPSRRALCRSGSVRTRI